MSVNQALSIAYQVVGAALLILLAAKIATGFGIRLPVNPPAAIDLAYLGGALWLIRK